MELIFLLEREQLLSVNVLEPLGDVLVHVSHSPALLLRHPGKHLSVTERSEMVIRLCMLLLLSNCCLDDLGAITPL